MSVASEGDNSKGGAKGDAPGRVQEGGTPPAQLGGMGEHCGGSSVSSPIGVWGGAP